MTEALDLAPLDAAMDDLADTFDGAEMLAILLDAAEPFKDQWQANIRSEGEIGDDADHYVDSLVIAPVFRKKVYASVEIAAAFTREKDPFYPAVLEYGSPTITARPVALRAFLQKRKEVVDSVADITGRNVTSRRLKTRVGRQRAGGSKASAGPSLFDLLGF